MSETPVSPGHDYLAAPSDLASLTGLNENHPAVLLALKRLSGRFRGVVNRHITLVTDDTYLASGDGTNVIRLPQTPIVGAPTVTVNGEAVTDFETGSRIGVLRLNSGVWPVGLENITVTYSHGFAAVPEDISDAVLDMAEFYINQSGVGVESITTDGEVVKLANSLANGGTTQSWDTAVAKYFRSLGDRS